jgi:predicted enzyme related to lactoylglutathione lyase
MLNFRVNNMTETAAHLASLGIAFEPQFYEGQGYFGHITDPEGNKIELWEDGFDYTANL